MSADQAKLKVAIVGCGYVGTIHARAYLEHPAVELVGLCDVNAERLETLSKRLHAPGYANIEELADRARPDLVSVVVRYSDLVDPIRRCLDAGLNVMSEKPISFDPVEILGLIALAKRRGVRFGVNFNQRFTLPSQWFRQLRDQGRFGDMLCTNCQYNQGRGNDHFALREHMIHQFDLWRYHLGEVAEVTGQAWWDETGRAEANPIGVAGSLQFESGVLGAFTNGFVGAGGIHHWYELVGTTGRGWCEDFVGQATFRPSDGHMEVRHPPRFESGANYWDSFTEHFRRVVDAMLNDQPLPVPAEAAFEAQCLCSAVIEAMETGRRVNVREVRSRLMNAAAT